MSLTFEDIRHDGGTHRVEVEIEGDQCVREDDLLRPGHTFEIPEKDFIRHVNQSHDEL